MSTSKPTDKKQQQNYVKSKVSKNFVQCPNRIIDASNITPVARLLWMYLASNSEDFTPSVDSISTALGINRKTVMRAKKLLLEHNMIHITKIENPRGGHKDSIACQDDSVWIDVEYNNQRSVETDEPIRLVPKRDLGWSQKGTEVGPKKGPVKIERKIKKENSSRGTGGEVRLSDPLPPDKSVTTTTTKSSLVRFYGLVNQVTGHASSGEKNAMFLAELEKHGPTYFERALKEIAEAGIKFVWHDPTDRTEFEILELPNIFNGVITEYREKEKASSD